jgi:hypothetical protein
MKPALRLTNPHSATSHCEPVADERALPPLPHIPTSYLQLKNLDKIHGMMRDYARAALASAPVAGPIQWPTMPPSKGQSPVLFEDGYAEGWAKCMDACRRAVSTASAPVAGERTAQEYGSPVDVAQRIEQYLYHDGRMNSGTQLLYEAMKALRGLARGSK